MSFDGKRGMNWGRQGVVTTSFCREKAAQVSGSGVEANGRSQTGEITGQSKLSRGGSSVIQLSLLKVSMSYYVV